MEPVEAKLVPTGLCLLILSLSLHLLHSGFLDRLTVHLDRVSRKRIPDLPLRFRSDGTFKILQIADMHFGNGISTRCRDVARSEFSHCSDVNTTRFIRRLIEAEKPDFLAFTGDNIFGPSSSDAAESMLRAFGPAVESRLPWAAILGNHDQESTMTRSELMYFISLMDYSVSRVYPHHHGDLFDREMNNIDGFGNYNLIVLGAVGSEMANSSVLNLLFLDSGDRATVGGRRTYGWIKESQLRWMHSVSQPQQALPALTFFHIPIPEVRKLYSQKIIGRFQEGVASSLVNSGVLDTLVSMKNVKAAFIGHDHVNDFCGDLSGVWFCYAGGIGYHGYGREGWPRRARVILSQLSRGENSWMGVERISTWKRLDNQIMSKIDEQVIWELRKSST